MVAVKKRLMDIIGETVKGRMEEAELSPLEDEIRKYILKGFARNGISPSPKEIPEGAVEFVSKRERGECTAETLCPFINLFCTKRHLEMWREKNPEFRDGEIYSPNEAMVHGKTIFGDFLE